MGVGGGHVVGAHAVDGDEQKDRLGIFLGCCRREPKKLRSENKSKSEKETENFTANAGFIHFAGKDTAKLAGIIAEMRNLEESSMIAWLSRGWAAHRQTTPFLGQNVVKSTPRYSVPICRVAR
jgi:hypothetical protein